MNSRILCRQFKIYCGLAVLAEANTAFQLSVGSGKFPLCEQGKAQSFVGKNLVNRIVYVLSAIQQMFGQGLSFTKRCTNEIPGPQTKHCRHDVFVKPTFFAQLKRSRVRMLHTVSTPALNCPEGVAQRRLKQQLRLVP